MTGPRFDRIVPLVTLVLVGLGVVFLLELNTSLLVVELGPNIPSFSVAWALIGALALITGVGVELVARGEPRLYASGWQTEVQLGSRRMELALPLWSVPMLTPIAVFAFFRLFRGAIATNAYLLVLLATGTLLVLVLVAQHYLIAGDAGQRRTARIITSVVVYALAFALFSAVTFNRYRTLYAVALIFPSVLLLGVDLLRGRVAALWTTAMVIALVVVEAYWAFNYWPAPFWFNSVALLVVLYVLVGMGQAAQAAAGDTPGAVVSLTRGAVLEYGLVGGGALLALVIAAAIARSQNVDLRLP